MSEMFRSRISNGKIVRPGFYRGADRSGVAYAEQVRTGALDASCVFCPEGLKQKNIEIVNRIGEKGLGAYVIQAKPAYAHYDAQRVIDHKLIVPDAHVVNRRDMKRELRDMIDEYIDEAERTAPDGVAIQEYTRRDKNPSKSIGHLHTHLFALSLAPLSRFSFDIDEGVTEAEFLEPTEEDIRAVEESRVSR